MADMIRTQDLSYSYTADETAGGIKMALGGVNLTVPRGQFLAVLGHNGSGKSTFAKTLNAILLPTGGKVFVDGIDTSDEARLFDVRKTVGMVFQNPDNQIVATVVEEDCAFAPENMGVPPEEIRRRVDDALSSVGMLKYKDRAPHHLSGGQKQRVAIAGVIAMQPACIVFDEPTAMLDPSGRREVMETIKKLNRELAITVILITHHMNEAVQADRVVVMNDGLVAMDDVPKKIFSRVEELVEYGLDVPQTVRILYELREAGYHVPIDALTVEECVDRLMRFVEARA